MLLVSSAMIQIDNKDVKNISEEWMFFRFENFKRDFAPHFKGRKHLKPWAMGCGSWVQISVLTEICSVTWRKSHINGQAQPTGIPSSTSQAAL